MTDTPLSSQEKKKLRGIAQRLKPSVQIGKEGVTPASLVELERALSREELIKEKVGPSASDFGGSCAKIAQELNCEIVGTVGRTVSFYRKKAVVGEVD